MSEIRGSDTRPPPFPWRRLKSLLRPMRGGLGAMVGLSTGGVLLGLVPPLALGVLVNALLERNDTAEGALLAGLIGLAIILETAAYVLSDGMYTRNAGRLYRSLRLQMFQGVLKASIAGRGRAEWLGVALHLGRRDSRCHGVGPRRRVDARSSSS